jgi:hypothetical protein
MKPIFRSLVIAAVAAGAAAGCSDSGSAPSPLSPHGMAPVFAKIKATDSTLALTNTSYSDTALVLKRLVALPADISQSAIIGPAGGEIKITETGGKIEIPAGALSAPTLITMKAAAGLNVAYDFAPHGLVFAKPVKIQQSLAGTWAEAYPQLVNGMHGAYTPVGLDSAWVDPGHYFAKITENEIGYAESNGSQMKFYIGHFSGYLFSCGRE